MLLDVFAECLITFRTSPRGVDGYTEYLADASNKAVTSGGVSGVKTPPPPEAKCKHIV